MNQPPSANVAGANDRIGIGVIGLSNGCGPGFPHALTIHNNAGQTNTSLVAVSDLYSHSRELARKVLKLNNSDIFTEYRQMLERKDVDAVIVATHDPWHAQICIDSAEAGKHIYCELPFTRYLGEAFTVYDRVKRTGVIFQAGAMVCSAEAWRQAAQLIKSGSIGPLVRGQGGYCRNNPHGEWNYLIPSDATADKIDWDRWLGPVKERGPFNAEHFRRWQKYYAYSCGPLGSLGSTYLYPLLFASGEPDFPVRVNCISTRAIHTDLGHAPEREVPEHVQLLAEFPSGFVIQLTCSTVSEFGVPLAICGHKGTLNPAYRTLEFLPENEFAKEIAPKKFTNLQPEDLLTHHKDWFDCIRSGTQPTANIDLALRVQTIVSLGEMSDRLKMTCLFDANQRRITTEDGREVAPITYGTLRQS